MRQECRAARILPNVRYWWCLYCSQTRETSIKLERCLCTLSPSETFIKALGLASDRIPAKVWLRYTPVSWSCCQWHKEAQSPVDILQSYTPASFSSSWFSFEGGTAKDERPEMPNERIRYTALKLPCVEMQHRHERLFKKKKLLCEHHLLRKCSSIFAFELHLEPGVPMAQKQS